MGSEYEADTGSEYVGFIWALNRLLLAPGMFQHCHQGAFLRDQEEKLRNLPAEKTWRGDLLRRPAQEKATHRNV